MSRIVQVEPEFDKVVSRKSPPCPLVNGDTHSKISRTLPENIVFNFVVSAVLFGYIGFLAATGFGFVFRGLPGWYSVTGGILLAVIFLLLLVANQTDPGCLPKRTAKGGFLQAGQNCRKG